MVHITWKFHRRCSQSSRNKCVTTGTIKECPVGNYMFKVYNRSSRTRCEICSKLTIKIPEWYFWTYFTPCSSVSIVNFEQVNALCLHWWYSPKGHSFRSFLKKTNFWAIVGTFYNLTSSWNIQGTWPMLSCKGHEAIMSVTQSFQLWQF